MDALLAGLVALPLLGGAWIAVVARRASASIVRYTTLAVTGLVALCTVALLFLDGDTPRLAVEWLPGMGPMTLGLGLTGLYAALVTAWSAFLALCGTWSHETAFSPWSGTLTLVALAAANVAFVAQHFLLRYAALEIVALCVALAPLVELGNERGSRLARRVYLILRLGDAGLLAAILILMDAGGTLDIAAALEAGETLDASRLGWVVAGFGLAAWVKLAGWPFQVWSQAGGPLSLPSRSWLYATVVPNLGAYLLYRVTPLLVLAGPLQRVVLWVGAGGAALAMLIALTSLEAMRSPGGVGRADWPTWLGAAQGGMALFVAASGVKTAVWLSLLAVTPLRLLLFLAADRARRAGSAAQCAGPATQRKVAAGFFALGGGGLTAWSLLTTWWAREAGAPLDALLAAEVAVALTGMWTACAAWRLGSDTRNVLAFPSSVAQGTLEMTVPGTGASGTDAPEMAAGNIARLIGWGTMGALGVGVLAGVSALRPLLRHLSTVSHGTLPTLPTPLALLRYAATAPAMLMVTVLALATWRLRWRLLRRARSGLPVSAGQEEGLPDQGIDLEEGLAQAARILRAVVEVGIQEQIIAVIVRGVVKGARLAQRGVEQGLLEGSVHWIARTAVGGGRWAYRVVEQEGLEGFVRRVVGAALSLGRGMQRWHTGRLRRNLLWVAISLAAAVVSVAVWGWQ